MDFQQEPILAVNQEMGPLLSAHYHEIAWNKEKIPLAPDWDRYGAIESAGKLVTYTARKNGVLVGYAIYFIDTHLHYKHTVFAQNDVLFLDKSVRGGEGARFIKWCEERLKEKGAQVHGIHIKNSFDWSPMAKRLGFESIEQQMSKWVGE